MALAFAVAAVLAFAAPRAPIHARHTARPPRVVAVDTAAARYVLKHEVDEAAMLAQSTFPIPPEELIDRAKRVMGEAKAGLEDETVLADDFEFCAPVVGPLRKDEYLGALRTFQLEEAFPDNNPQYHAFRVDCFEPDRVWFCIRAVATHTGMGGPQFGAPTGKRLELPPQMYSLRFSPEGKVREITVGYVMDRRVGNTGGLGGAFGYFYGIGRPLPIPECQPYKRSWQFKLLNIIGRLTTRTRN